MDINKFTEKAREGVAAAVELAKGSNNPQIEPEHLLELMWRAAAGPQRQDFLTYVRGAIRKEEQRGRLRKAGRDTEEADGWAGWTVIGDDEGGEQDL